MRQMIWNGCHDLDKWYADSEGKTLGLLMTDSMRSFTLLTVLRCTSSFLLSWRKELKKHITEGFRGLCYTIWQAKEKREKLVKGHEAFTKREKSASTKWEQEELKWALQNNLSISFDSVLVHISQYLRALSTDQKSACLEWNGLNWNDKMKRFWKKNPQNA